MAILSIQSHVVYGYVGNTAATFPLQLLGHDVWAVNTVEFSNHTGFGSWRGRVLSGELVTELVSGLEERGALDTCEAVLSGYLGDAGVGLAVLEAVAKVRRAAPGALYCCDPVMGDYGRGFFVQPGIPEILRERIVPRADIVTPNQFELEALTGVTVRSLDDARRAVRAVHELGPRVVLVTSYHGAEEAVDHIDMLVSDGGSFHQVRTPKLPFDPSPNGAGDLIAALFLSRYLQSGDAAAAMEHSAASVYGVLAATFARRSPNLCLISAQKEIVSPTQVFSAFGV
jgi:pyridoxine kinase